MRPELDGAGAGAVLLVWLGGARGTTGDLPGVAPADAGGTGTLLCSSRQSTTSVWGFYSIALVARVHMLCGGCQAWQLQRSSLTIIFSICASLPGMTSEGLTLCSPTTNSMCIGNSDMKCYRGWRRFAWCQRSCWGGVLKQ